MDALVHLLGTSGGGSNLSYVDCEPLTENLCWLLSRASHVLTTEMAAALEETGMSPRAHMVLRAALDGDHTQIELARAVGLDKTTMVATVDHLEGAGWAERRPSPHDRRARVIAVTEAGRAKLEEAERATARVRQDVLETLDEDDRDIFLRALSRLACERLAEPVECAHPVRRARAISSVSR
jgi:MarR family transcriptional regulator for hemolysin